MGPATDEGPPRRRVLLADDEPHIRRVLETVLESTGFAVDSADTGSQALGRLRDPLRRYDLVLSDLMMPDGGGLDVLEGLKAMEHRAGTPVVILTAKGQEADRERALQLGAADFLTKPFSPRKLVARIREILDGG